MQKTKNARHRLVQQQLPHWNPNLTIGTTLPMFLIVGLLFVCIGIVILFILQNAHEVVVDYTSCRSADNANKTCADVIGNSTRRFCRCEIPFHVDVDIDEPVFVYYALTNFYQNHRNYLTSRDNQQLMGRLNAQVSAECKPLDYVYRNNVRVPIAPCGAIANSMFTDSLSVYSVNHSRMVPLIRTGIAWPQIKRKKYQNPPGDLRQAFSNFSKPIAWNQNVWELDADPSNNGFENEDFIVWMQPSTLPTFRKLYRRVNHTSVFNKCVPRGDYRLLVEYKYPVAVFGGTKSFILANSTIFGAKNLFLGFAYLLTGVICIVVAIVFCGIHLHSKKLA